MDYEISPNQTTIRWVSFGIILLAFICLIFNIFHFINNLIQYSAIRKMGTTQLKNYFSSPRKSVRSRRWSLGRSRRRDSRLSTPVQCQCPPASLYLGVSECGSGVGRCQGGSQRYSLPSIVIKSYGLVCQVSSASVCHERGEH